MERVAVLGTGKMGEALLSGMLRAGRKPMCLPICRRAKGKTRPTRIPVGAGCEISSQQLAERLIFTDVNIR